eukprot:3293423-Rhodomonas_salina.1
MSIDFCGPFPLTKRGNDYVCGFIDNLTREVVLVPCSKTVTVKETARLYVHHAMKVVGGVQRSVGSDSCPQFISHFWKYLWKALGTKVVLSAPYHPESNSMIEHQNKTFIENLQCFITSLQDDWDDHLVPYEFAYNASVNPSTGESPFFLNHGQPLTMPVAVVHPTPSPAVDDFVTMLRNWIAAAQHYNLQLLSQKLAPRYLGPLTVLEIRCPNTVRIEVPPRLARIEPLQNVKHLKPYVTLPPAVGPTHVPVGPELVDDAEEYEVEDIIAHHGAGNQVEYLVRFTSYDAADDLWLPARNLKNTPDIVSAYHARQRDQAESRQGARQRAPRRLQRLGHVWNYGGP